MPPRGCANERCLAFAAGEFPDPDGTGRWHNVASKGGLVMRQIDFAPLYRSTVGFDRLFDMLEGVSGFDAGPTAYPPYNIERLGDSEYRITMAVAGFSEDALKVDVKEQTLNVRG